ncbi:bifunctional polynucleotide phosphatase/kinase-like [Argopecten irradians]|uniref:bifunctional polynucleotide phosphatase/kinase-like n=1 Tax=Argopecten irradians TaxID=31199 RepID=UPI0037212A7F
MSKYKVRFCNLVCPNNTHDPIPLPHGETVAIGRSPLTRIMDPRCSRNQLEVTADWKTKVVMVKQVGNNSSALDGIEMEKGRQCKLEDGATIYILAGQYPQKVEFGKEKVKNSNDMSAESNGKTKKRPASDNGHSSHNTKKARISNSSTVTTESSSEEEEHVKSVEEKLQLMKQSPKKHQEKKLSNSKHSNENQTPSTSKLASPCSSKCSDDKTVKKGANCLGLPREDSKWEHHDKLYVYTGKGVRASSKIAGFDIDGTIITTKSGRVFPKDNADWKLIQYKRICVNVSDAAGRPAKWAPGKKKDFSCSDRMFAMNAGLKFYTPEEYFLNQSKAKYDMPDYDPRKVDSGDCLTDPVDAKVVSSTQEMVILVGFPASGKSFFSTSQLVPKGYIQINRDTLGTWQKCVAMCNKSLKENKSVVIDNTNTTKEQRERYISLAKKAGIPCRCFLFTASSYQCRHNERYREMVDKSHKPISEITMNSMRSKYEEPDTSEGFSEIVKINFVPQFDNPRHERWYKMFLVEK